jgi:hypothetical protein
VLDSAQARFPDAKVTWCHGGRAHASAAG